MSKPGGDEGSPGLLAVSSPRERLRLLRGVAPRFADAGFGLSGELSFGQLLVDGQADMGRDVTSLWLILQDKISRSCFGAAE